MNVLLDTNLLTRWVNTADPSHQTATQPLRVLRKSGHVPTVVPQNLYEFWVVATRPFAANGLGYTPDEAATELDSLAGPLFRLLQDERAILPHWRTLVKDYQVQGKPAHDARLVAAMLRHGLTHVVTFNVADFNRYSEVIPIHPAEIVSGAASLTTSAP